MPRSNSSALLRGSVTRWSWWCRGVSVESKNASLRWYDPDQVPGVRGLSPPRSQPEGTPSVQINRNSRFAEYINGSAFYVYESAAQRPRPGDVQGIRVTLSSGGGSEGPPDRIRGDLRFEVVFD